MYIVFASGGTSTHWGGGALLSRHRRSPDRGSQNTVKIKKNGILAADAASICILVHHTGRLCQYLCQYMALTVIAQNVVMLQRLDLSHE